MTRDFSVEQIAAFLLGVADDEDRDAIAKELPHNQELRAQLALMGRLVSLGGEAGSESGKPTQQSEGQEPTVEMHLEETALPAGATPKYIRPLPENLEEVAQLDEQGLDVSEIASRSRLTETLVALKLHRLNNFRS